MGLIAVDKLNRKVLGYLCRNGNILLYCCVECDVEYEAANQLEAHMLKHELQLQEVEEQQQQPNENVPIENVPNENEGMEADTTNGEVNNIPLTQEEIENRLRLEYDLKECSIPLFRFVYDIDDLQSDADDTSFQSMSAGEEDEKSNGSKNEKSTETKTLRKRNKVPSPRSRKAHPVDFHICFICAKKFISIDELTKHQKIHSSTDSSVLIPCSICGHFVKDLKRHLRDHELDSAYELAMSTSDDNMVMESIDDSVIESIDDVIKQENRDSFDTNDLQTIGLEVEYIVTSDSEFNVSTTSNIPNGVDFNDIDIDIRAPKTPTKSKIKRKSNAGEFQCTQCPKRFRLELLLNQHLRNHERPRVPCPICGKRTTIKYSKIHMLRFHTPNVSFAQKAEHENDVVVIEEQ